MSHITTVTRQFKSLTIIRKAGERLGLEFNDGKTTFRAYYSNASNSCEHTLSVPGIADAYEIGIAKAPDGSGYTFKYDSYAGGKGLMEKVSTDGRTLNRLEQAYSVEVAKREMRRKGYRCREQVDAHGNIQVVAIAG